MNTPAAPRLRLAPRQAAVLVFLRAFIRERGYPPTLREIGAAMGITSTHGVADHLASLKRKGYIAGGATGESRAIRLLDAPGEAPAAAAPASPPGRDTTPPILVYGSIERGEIADTIRRPSMMPTAVCALVVGSETLSHVGIRRGDWVFVEKPGSAASATLHRKLVAVRLGDETVLRYARRAGDMVRLSTGEPGSADAFLQAADFSAGLRGVAVGLWRGGVAPGAAAAAA